MEPDRKGLSDFLCIGFGVVDVAVLLVVCGWVMLFA